jgi:hypothetical protein
MHNAAKLEPKMDSSAGFLDRNQYTVHNALAWKKNWSITVKKNIFLTPLNS